jgi:Na+/proline symporter
MFVRKKPGVNQLLVAFYTLVAIALATFLYIVKNNEHPNSTLKNNNNLNDITQGILIVCSLLGIFLIIQIVVRLRESSKVSNAKQWVASVIGVLIASTLVIGFLVAIFLFWKDYKF